MIKNVMGIVSLIDGYEIHLIIILNRIICIKDQLLEMLFI